MPTVCRILTSKGHCRLNLILHLRRTPTYLLLYPTLYVYPIDLARERSPHPLQNTDPNMDLIPSQPPPPPPKRTATKWLGRGRRKEKSDKLKKMFKVKEGSLCASTCSYDTSSLGSLVPSGIESESCNGTAWVGQLAFQPSSSSTSGQLKHCVRF